MEAKAGCDRALLVSLSSLQRSLMLTIFGMSSTDRTHMAEISIERSISEITQAENETRQQLQELVEAVRKRTGSKNMTELKRLLMQSSSLRKQLCTLEARRIGMGAQMDKLRTSKLNMQMLQSMKHTNIALQNIGLKVSDADAIMLDLDEARNDAQDVQNSLSSSLASEDDQFDLEAELQLMLSEDALLGTQPKTKTAFGVQPLVVHDTEVLLPAVAQSSSKPPDEPPSASELEDSSAQLAVVYAEAVTPVSTLKPSKVKARGGAREKPPQETADEDEATPAT